MPSFEGRVIAFWLPSLVLGSRCIRLALLTVVCLSPPLGLLFKIFLSAFGSSFCPVIAQCPEVVLSEFALIGTGGGGGSFGRAVIQLTLQLDLEKSWRLSPRVLFRRHVLSLFLWDADCRFIMSLYLFGVFPVLHPFGLSLLRSA